MTTSAIEEAIPHRPPMLLVDRIIERREDWICCEKTFRDDEFFVQGHYPGQPIVPGVILCEFAMQSGAILLSQHLASADGVPVATRMNDVRFRRMVRPGDVVQAEVQLDERLAQAFYLTAKVVCQDKVAVRFQFACTLAPADSPPS